MLQTLTKEQREKMQKRLLLRNYKHILEPEEAQQYQSKIAKTVFSLIGLCIVTPFVGYHLYTYRANLDYKRVRIFNGMIL